ncbi:MAG TPA: hypothetical protein VMR77_03605 [Patescibacteria group bacterium]|nr:hypothetical protein [Patescibacteria group bacterium]
MTDEAVDSRSENNPKEQADAQQRINEAMQKARLIINLNNLFMAFNLNDLNDPAQKRKAVLLEAFITEQLLVDELGGKKLSKDLITPSETALQLVVQQNQFYLANPEGYPGAGNIRFAVHTLFDMVHEKTGKSINPEIPIDKPSTNPDKRIMLEWRQRFS